MLKQFADSTVDSVNAEIGNLLFFCSMQPLTVESTDNSGLCVSLTVPNRDHFAQVSLTVLDIFLDASTKAKKTNL